jgi:hypothetical protein
MTDILLKCDMGTHGCTASGVRIGIADYYEELKSANYLYCSSDTCSGELRPTKSGAKKLKFFSLDQARIERQEDREKVLGKRKPFQGSYDERDSGDETEDDEDDPEFKLLVVFRPSLRYTADAKEADRLAFDNTLSAKTTGIVSITNPIDGERTKSTATAMGRPAWDLAKKKGAVNAKRYSLGSKNYYEWCHLLADTLGGACDSKNLVAAHYAVNTYMLSIESHLKAKDYKVNVTAYCKHTDIADYIDYQIWTSPTKSVTVRIDGHITKYNALDHSATINLLKSKGI